MMRSVFIDEDFFEFESEKIFGGFYGVGLVFVNNVYCGMFEDKINFF